MDDQPPRDAGLLEDLVGRIRPNGRREASGEKKGESLC